MGTEDFVRFEQSELRSAETGVNVKLPSLNRVLVLQPELVHFARISGDKMVVSTVSIIVPAALTVGAGLLFVLISKTLFLRKWRGR